MKKHKIISQDDLGRLEAKNKIKESRQKNYSNFMNALIIETV